MGLAHDPRVNCLVHCSISVRFTDRIFLNFPTLAPQRLTLTSIAFLCPYHVARGIMQRLRQCLLFLQPTYAITNRTTGEAKAMLCMFWNTHYRGR